MIGEKCIHEFPIVFANLEKYGFPFTHTCDCADLNVIMDFLIIIAVIEFLWCFIATMKQDREQAYKDKRKEISNA